jgi:glycosyltransferase involved in cell wall biosynthesis
VAPGGCDNPGMAVLRVGLDATPTLGQVTGIGRYVTQLIGALAPHESAELRAAAFTVRARRGLRALPQNVRRVHRPVPARLLNAAWLRGDVPSAESVFGRIDVVHGTNFVLPPPRHAAGVVTVHDLTFLHHPEWVDAASLAYRDLVARAVRRAGAVIAVTHAVASDIADAYQLPPDRIAVTHLGVEPAWFEPAARPRTWPNEYVLAVGSIEPRKGIDVLLAAYRQLLDADADLPPLVVVGPSGWGERPDFTALPADRVLLAGYLAPEDLRGAVAAASLLVFPSRYEGFGLPPLEALAAGTPVVASDLPAVREVVGSHATLVPVGDVEALADAVARVLTNPPGAGARAAARRHAASFTWAECADATLEIYRRVSS